MSAVSATLKDRVSGGTYNLRLGAGHTDGTGWTPGAGSDAAAAAFSGSTSAQTSTNDLYVVPGSYSLQISYTLTKGSYTQTFTKTGSIALVAGKTNNITATAVGGAAAEIKFGVSITPWSANAIELAWEPDANGHDYVDLGFRVGGNKILFATCNIGAANPQDYGDYFAWGETSKRYTSIDGNTVTGATFEWSNAPYHTGSSSSTGWTKYIPTAMSSYWSGGGSLDNKTVLDLSDDVAHVLWGGDWRMPTAEELCMLINGDGTSTTADAVSNITYTWTSNYNSTDVAGLLITGKGEYSSASLFLPAAGCCNGSGRDDAGDFGDYWSRSLDADDPMGAWDLGFGDGNQKWMGIGGRCNGRSVRPVLVVPA